MGKKKIEKTVKILKEGYPGESDSNFFTFNLWEKHGLKRVYMNDYKRRTIGYIENGDFTECDRCGCSEREIQAAVHKFCDCYEI